ncbi:chain length determinant protein, partial [Polaribacter sp. IC066]|uniref:Wzz/FepE/Etk N-terminal domain-containing protein n=1 Tax=Polaribacter sp. IC066 TaxID=57032 RepID=UPI0011C2994F
MQENNKNFGGSQIENADTINIREELEKYLVHWKWFVFCVILSLSLAFIYLRYATPQYSAAASIMIKDNNKSGISSELAAFEDLGIIGGGSANNPDNEIEILKSRKIIGNMVDSLDLTISYFMEGTIKKSEVYDKNPLVLEFIKKNFLAIEKDTAFVISRLDENNIEFKTLDGDLISRSTLNTVIESELGQFKIHPRKDFDKDSENNEVIILLRGRNRMIDTYRARIGISTVDKNSSVLTLSLQDAVKVKAEDVLNELVRQYNLDAIKDKSIVSEKTKDFIEERLTNVGAFLALAQDNVQE